MMPLISAVLFGIGVVVLAEGVVLVVWAICRLVLNLTGRD